jgi:hypothetical protein
MRAYDISRQTLPYMLYFFQCIIRGQDIDDAEVVDMVEVGILLVRRTNATIILVKDEMLAFSMVFLWQRDRFKVLRVRLAHEASYGAGFRRGRPLDLGRFTLNLGYCRLWRIVAT